MRGNTVGAMSPATEDGMGHERSDDRDVAVGRTTDLDDGRSSRSDIDRFLAATKRVARRTAGARLIFALDATMSRQPTWDNAAELQAAMFDEATRGGALEVQLAYYRGEGECRASRWVADAARLRALMRRIACRAGPTALGRILAHTAAEARAGGIAGLVFVGDAVEEDPAALYDLAGGVALAGVPCFMFQEGRDRSVATVFSEIARLTRGAHVPFDVGAAERLGELLRAVAAWATGGPDALAALAARPEGAGARHLIGRMTS